MELEDEFIDQEDLKAHLGYGNLGILLMPTKYDEYEHSVINFKGPGGRQSVKSVSLLMFGGINFNSTDKSQKTFLLDIDVDRTTFTMTFLPKTKLPQPEIFMSTQPLHMNNDLNVVTLVGKCGVSRINIS